METEELLLEYQKLLSRLMECIRNGTIQENTATYLMTGKYTQNCVYNKNIRDD